MLCTAHPRCVYVSSEKDIIDFEFEPLITVGIFTQFFITEILVKHHTRNGVFLKTFDVLNKIKILNQQSSTVVKVSFTPKERHTQKHTRREKDSLSFYIKTFVPT